MATPTILQTVRGIDVIPFQYAELLAIPATPTEDDLVIIDMRNVKNLLWHIQNVGANNLQYQMYATGKEQDTPPAFGDEWIPLHPNNITVNGTESVSDEQLTRFTYILMRGRSQQGTNFNVFIRGHVD